MLVLDQLDTKAIAHMPAAVKFVNANRHRANAYVFTDEVTEQLALLIKEHPEALLGNYQFAIPPYETCYLEFNIKLWHRCLGITKHESEDDRAGFLIHRSTVCSVAMSAERGAALGPICYLIPSDHTRPVISIERVGSTGLQPFFFGPTANEEGIMRHFNLQLALFMGNLLHHPKANFTQERVGDFASRYAALIDTELMKILSFPANHKHAQTVLDMCAGDMRDILALLLWIAQPSLYDLEHRHGNKSWYRWPSGKTRFISLLAHHVVKLRKDVTRRRLLRAFRPRDRVRRHEVQAFWRQFNRTACEHDWPIFPDENGHWKCRKCPQWRTRVKQHERGDIAKGIITKEYKV